MTEVYIVEYGVHDQDADTFDSIWAEFDDAMAYAEQSAQEMFDDNLDYTEMGWTYDIVVGNEDTRVVIQDENGDDIEWWRVTKQPVR